LRKNLGISKKAQEKRTKAQDTRHKRIQKSESRRTNNNDYFK
jgi:hypothetical protein